MPPPSQARIDALIQAFVALDPDVNVQPGSVARAYIDTLAQWEEGLDQALDVMRTQGVVVDQERVQQLYEQATGRTTGRPIIHRVGSIPTRWQDPLVDAAVRLHRDIPLTVRPIRGFRHAIPIHDAILVDHTVTYPEGSPLVVEETRPIQWTDWPQHLHQSWAAQAEAEAFRAELDAIPEPPPMQVFQEDYHPIRTELTVLPADAPRQTPLGWRMEERVGVAAFNPRGLRQSGVFSEPQRELFPDLRIPHKVLDRRSELERMAAQAMVLRPPFWHRLDRDPGPSELTQLPLHSVFWRKVDEEF